MQDRYFLVCELRSWILRDCNILAGEGSCARIFWRRGQYDVVHCLFRLGRTLLHGEGSGMFRLLSPSVFSLPPAAVWLLRVLLLRQGAVEYVN